jgi:hypothetical protein
MVKNCYSEPLCANDLKKDLEEKKFFPEKGRVDCILVERETYDNDEDMIIAVLDKC